MAAIDRVLVHVTGNRRLPIEPAKIYYLEADVDETLLRSRSKQIMRDLRSLGEVLPSFEPHGFVRVHRGHAVNLRMIREIKLRESGEGWELRLKPPVNLVLPIGETFLKKLWQAFG
jgi:DNA-binding LytR/AlgR family response regulator